MIQELCRQQWDMYKRKSHQIEDRIVSIDQPHIRPIVRGKAGRPVEFGATAGLWTTILTSANWSFFQDFQMFQPFSRHYFTVILTYYL